MNKYVISHTLTNTFSEDKKKKNTSALLWPFSKRHKFSSSYEIQMNIRITNNITTVLKELFLRATVYVW